MSRFKSLTAILFLTFHFPVFANENEKNIDSKETLVIKYDYPKEEVVKESTAKLHQNSSFSYHGKGEFNVKILGEKKSSLFQTYLKVLLILKSIF